MFLFKKVSQDTLDNKNFQKIIDLLQHLELVSLNKYKINLKVIKYKVKFELLSTNKLGLFKVNLKNKMSIHLNEFLFKESSFSDFKEIIIHEFAHLLSYLVYGPLIDPHGPKWKSIMKELGSKSISSKTNTFSLIKRKPSDCIASCKCTSVVISAHRATKIKNGVKYRCRKCNSHLILK